MSSLANLVRATDPAFDMILDQEAGTPAPPPVSPPAPTRVVPPVPESLVDAGVSDSMIEQLILKYLYYRGEMLGRDIASLLGLRFSLVDPVLETMKRQHQIQVRKSLGMGNTSA